MDILRYITSLDILNTRINMKHADEHTPEIFVEALEMIRKELYDTLEHHKLILD
jgi:molecular chaperone GrpE (heat shock protein)